MADFGRVLAAMDAAGLTCDALLPRYLSQGGRIAAEVIDGDLFAVALIDLVSARGEWEGTATELLSALLPDSTKPPTGWPKPNGVKGRLIAVVTGSATHGVAVTIPEARSSRGRIIKLESSGNKTVTYRHCRHSTEKMWVK